MLFMLVSFASPFFKTAIFINSHLIYCPIVFSWWVINTVCVALMCVSGEFLCMRTELRAIPVSMASQKVD